MLLTLWVIRTADIPATLVALIAESVVTTCRGLLR